MSCKNCGKDGHYAKTCSNNDLSTLEPEKVETGRSLREIGQKILKQENTVVERAPDALGTVPAKGLWLVNLDRKRIAGKISQVKKTGEILWIDHWNCLIESSPETIKAGGYLFIDLEPKHLSFEVTSLKKSPTNVDNSK